MRLQVVGSAGTAGHMCQAHAPDARAVRRPFASTPGRAALASHAFSPLTALRWLALSLLTRSHAVKPIRASAALSAP